jgi:hypothetical protein
MKHVAVWGKFAMMMSYYMSNRFVLKSVYMMKVQIFGITFIWFQDVEIVYRCS